MSYILDALRKADAQRERDPARGIHAQPLRDSPLPVQDRGRRSVMPWAAGAVGVAAMGWTAWFLYQDRAAVAQIAAPRTEVVVQAAPPVPPPPPAPLLVPPPAPAPVVGTSVQPPAPPPAPVAAPPVRDPRMTSQPSQRGGSPPAPGSVPVAPPALSPTPPVVTAPTGGAPTSALRAPSSVAAPALAAPAAAVAAPVTGLPPDAPRLAIGGGVYSANPAQRMIIVNGQVFNEGSEIGPGVVVEEIKSKNAVLRFRGARYTVSY